MVIRILDHVKNCHSWADGEIINRQIRRAFARTGKACLSFDGVRDVPSSFVNAAIIHLLRDYSPDYIRSNLMIVDSTRQINDLIKRRFSHVASTALAVA